VEDCRLEYTSPNAPHKRNVLGTILLSVLSGHWRYAHISAIRGDGVNPELLGMKKAASEDSVRRALLSMKEEDSDRWMKQHLKASYEPLLEEPCVAYIRPDVSLELSVCDHAAVELVGRVFGGRGMDSE
jgi:hypothetical protein